MILITTQNFPPDHGGIEALMGGLADHLAGAGEKIAIYADRIRATGLQERTGLGYEIHRFGNVKPLRRRTKARAVAQAVREKGVTAVFADSYKSIELLPVVSVPIAVLAHGMEFPVRPSSFKRARIRRALAKARTVIANSAYTASLVRPYLDDGDRRLRIINPPISEQPEPSKRTMDEVRRIIAGRSPVLLSLSRLEPRKGIDMVVRSLADVLKSRPNAVFIIAGGGDDRTRLERIATEVGVRGHVHFTGAVDADLKPALFASADLFVMPARRDGDSVEGFGIAYVEAAWYGVPSIAGREGGAADAVLDGKTGWLCDASDVADVRRTIERALGDSAARTAFGAAAARRARQVLQWSAALPAFLDAIQ